MFGAKKKARFYHQLTTLLRSGISVNASMDLLERQAGPAMLPVVAGMKHGLASGLGLGDAMREAPTVTSMEASVMGAAERGGKLEQGARHLADYYQLIASLWRDIFTSMAYPLLVLHVAILLPGLVEVISGASIWAAMIKPLIIAWALIILVVAGGNLLWTKGSTNAGIDSFLNKIPFLGNLRRKMSLARFCKVLEIHLQTGGQVSEAVKAAGKASGSAGIMNEAMDFADIISREGCPLGPLLMGSRKFPAPLSQVLSTAESVGRMDEEAGARAEELMREAGGTATGGTVWLPRLLYAPIALYAIYKIFTMASGYYNTLSSGLDL